VISTRGEIRVEKKRDAGNEILALPRPLPLSPQTNAPNFTFSTVTTILWEKLKENPGSRIRDKWSALLQAVMIVARKNLNH
jgi:hypothetical protein